MRISDWSSDVCSSDLASAGSGRRGGSASHSLHGQPGSALRFPARRSSGWRLPPAAGTAFRAGQQRSPAEEDRKSDVKGKSVAVRVEPGGDRIITKKKNNHPVIHTAKTNTKTKY